MTAKVTLRDVYELIEHFREEVKEGYVTQQEFKPVKACVYGLVALILTAVMMAMVAQVIIAYL